MYIYIRMCLHVNEIYFVELTSSGIFVQDTDEKIDDLKAVVMQLIQRVEEQKKQNEQLLQCIEEQKKQNEQLFQCIEEQKEQNEQQLKDIMSKLGK